jgi:hypothetical protein
MREKKKSITVNNKDHAYLSVMDDTLSQFSQADIIIAKGYLDPSMFQPDLVSKALGASIEVIDDNDDDQECQESDDDEIEQATAMFANLEVTKNIIDKPSRFKETVDSYAWLQEEQNDVADEESNIEFDDPESPAMSGAATPRQQQPSQHPQQQQPQQQQQQHQQQQQKARRSQARAFEQTQYVPNDILEIDINMENHDPKIRREKQEILFQLLKNYPAESAGQWNMGLPLFELKYELERRVQFTQEQEQIAFMKSMFKMIITGIEVLNAKFGPFLSLTPKPDGTTWAESIHNGMDANSGTYDRCMKALYQRYFKTKKMNPILELLWLIAGSAVMWHLQSKFAPPSAPLVQPISANKHGDIQPPGGNPQKFSFGGANAPQMPPGLNLGSILGLFAKH